MKLFIFLNNVFELNIYGILVRRLSLGIVFLKDG